MNDSPRNSAGVIILLTLLLSIGYAVLGHHIWDRHRGKTFRVSFRTRDKALGMSGCLRLIRSFTPNE